MTHRVTKTSSEVLYTGDGEARITKMDSEVLYTGSGEGRVSKLSVEVLYPIFIPRRVMTTIIN